MLYKKFFKRILDLVLSLLLLTFFLPVILTLTVAFAITGNGRPFFIQPRPGFNGKIFNLVKFRTMTEAKDALGNYLPDEKRLTKFGKFIRKTSLDELPQLVNVVLGDMSLIGPRPLLPEYLPLYNEYQRRRHNVRPGITGWAQVNGRNALTWDRKFELDIWYVENLSLSVDLRIMAMTIFKVIRPEGISSATSATMEKFTGN